MHAPSLGPHGVLRRNPRGRPPRPGRGPEEVREPPVVRVAPALRRAGPPPERRVLTPACRAVCWRLSPTMPSGGLNARRDCRWCSPPMLRRRPGLRVLPASQRWEPPLPDQLARHRPGTSSGGWPYPPPPLRWVTSSAGVIATSAGTRCRFTAAHSAGQTCVCRQDTCAPSPPPPLCGALAPASPPVTMRRFPPRLGGLGGRGAAV